MEGSWILPVEMGLVEGYPPTLHVEGRELCLKEELHLTLMNRALSARVNAHARASDLRDAVQAFIDHMGGHLTERVTDTAWVLREAEALTVAVSVDLPEMLSLFERLEQMGLSVAPPAPHITLYMAGTDKGIGVQDEAALSQHLVARCSLRELLVAELLH